MRFDTVVRNYLIHRDSILLFLCAMSCHLVFIFKLQVSKSQFFYLSNGEHNSNYPCMLKILTEVIILNLFFTVLDTKELFNRCYLQLLLIIIS